MARQLHLNLNILNMGRHPAAWLVQAEPRRFLTLDHFIEVARIAEGAKFDAVFLSDGITLPPQQMLEGWQPFDPFVILSAIAARTSHIGLIGTMSTTFNEPFNVARRVASLDHLSAGRAAWNIVTSMSDQAARNFGLSQMPRHEERYARAEEFVSVVTKLWDSWDADAVVADPDSGLLLNEDAIHSIDHVGTHFKVAGPLSVPRTPQGRPILVQAGSSGPGQALAARNADIVFTVQTVIEEARIFYRTIKDQAAAFGRDRNAVKILPGFFPVVGSTHEEALRNKARLDQMLDLSRDKARLADQLGIDDDALRLDEELPYHLQSAAEHKSISLGFAASTWALGRSKRMTVRQILLSNGGFHRQLVGTPEMIAADMEHWFLSGAADGFNLNFDTIPDGLTIFADTVVPLLQRRGIFREDYEGHTLRDRLNHAEEAVTIGA